MEALVANLPSFIMALLVAFVFPLLTYYVKKWIDGSTLNANTKSLLLRLDDAVTSAVSAVAQATTDNLKESAKDGKLTAAEAAAARAAALDKVKSYLGQPGLDLLKQILGGSAANDPSTDTALTAYLTDKVEGAVRADKLAKASTDSVAKALAEAGK